MMKILARILPIVTTPMLVVSISGEVASIVEIILGDRTVGHHFLKLIDYTKVFTRLRAKN